MTSCLNRAEEHGIIELVITVTRDENKEFKSTPDNDNNNNSSHSLHPLNVPGLMLTALLVLMRWVHKAPGKDACQE